MFKNIIFLTLPLVLLSIAFWYCHNRSDYEVFPVKEDRFNIFSDSKWGKGNSYIVKKFSSDSVQFKSYIKSRILNPYAGFSLKLNPNRHKEKEFKNYTDLSDFDHVELIISSKNLTKLSFSVNTFYEGVTDSLQSNSFRRNRKELNIKEGKQKFKFALEQLETPQWWAKNYKTLHDSLSKPRYDLAYNLSFVMGSIKNEAPGSVTIKSIKFKKDYGRKFIIYTAIYLVGALIFVGLIFFKKDKNSKKEVVVSYVQRELTRENNFVEKSDKGKIIITYMAENYHKPDLSVKEVATVAEIPQNSVSKLLKDNLDKTFKGYLNELRFREAKRLLLSTENTISEIAYAVGFNSPNSFNRVFKMLEGSSPSEFRNNENLNEA